MTARNEQSPEQAPRNLTTFKLPIGEQRKAKLRNALLALLDGSEELSAEEILSVFGDAHDLETTQEKNKCNYNEQKESIAYQNCCVRVLQEWPRVSSFLLGVVVPLWGLILLSLFFGFFLARAEAPVEIVHNNLQMESLLRANVAKERSQTFGALLPKVCLDIYFVSNYSNLDLSPLSIEGQEADELKIEIEKASLRLFEPDLIDLDKIRLVNQTKLGSFMEICGTKARELADQHLQESLDATASISGATFNWIRCKPKELRPSSLLLLYENQESYFQTAWSLDQQVKYEEYLQDYQKDIPLDIDPREREYLMKEVERKAFQLSVQEASGEESCNYNTAGSAWFWFTVMTTIGYGNQIPETTAGRTMIYTLGFVSILLFAAILAVAGYVVAVIFQDAVVHCNLQRFFNPLTEMCLWGFVYYIWMVFIAAITRKWKRDQLGEEISWQDSYWLAFLSTTSVGLGDIFYETHSITIAHLMYLPLMFLIGFVFLSAFLQRMALGYRYVYKKFAGAKDNHTPLLQFIMMKLSIDDMWDESVDD